jgi:hypothetical protein
MHVSEKVAIDRLEDNYYNILEGQVLNSVVVITVRLHRAVADELVDGKIGSSWVGWLTFFCCGNLVKMAHFLAVIIILGKNGILVDGLTQDCTCINRMHVLQYVIHCLAGH